MTVRDANVMDAAGIARVHVDSWRTTYRGIVSDDYLDSLSYQARESYWHNVLSNPDYKGFVYVADDEAGHIAGFAAGGPAETPDPLHEGELYVIYILQEHQGKGLGRRLVSAVASRLLQTDIRSIKVWVIANNPFRIFYERLGGRELAQQEFEIGGITLTEVAYGWPDVRSLI